MDFVHLHVHSHYSILDGLIKIDDLVSKLKEYKMSACALTDHGGLYGIIEFYKKCKENDIKPIIGVEAYLCDDIKIKNPKQTLYHIVLLAKNNEGYKNLIKLVSISYLKGFYYKPRIDKKLLKKYSNGLIGLSSCLKGEIPSTLLNFGFEKAKEVLEEYIGIFGKDNFYLELEDHPELEDQDKANILLYELAKKFGIGVVGTKDSHYLNQDDKEAEEVLLCIQTNKHIQDKDRMSMRKIDVSFPSKEKMVSAFKEFPEAIENTLKIASMCNVEIELGKWKFPRFEIKPGYTYEKLLIERAKEGLLKRLKFDKKLEKIPDKYNKRLEYELDIITKKGYAPYFLIVADYVNWARDKGIILTTRGSAAGSLVSYSLRIIDIDPIEFDLPFERFLNPFRPSPPDIDVDFQDTRREEVFEYIKNKYGEDKVAHIGTFGTFQARAVVRDVARVLGFPYSLGDKIAKSIPPSIQGFPMTLKRALKISPEFKEMYEKDPKVKRIVDLAKKLEGGIRHLSVHAAGVVISPESLTNFVPLQKDPGGGRKIVTQFEMHAIEDIGLLKMDFLGNRNLSIIDLALKLIEKNHNKKIELKNIPLDDEDTYKFLSKGYTQGVFQLSGSGITQVLRELKPSNIFDIMALISLYRPGPMEFIPEYIRRKHNPKYIKYLDYRLKDILNRTFGVITYQDDVLLIAVKLAGYNWKEADKLRKAIGKKIPKEMAAQKTKFISGCVKNGLSQEKAVALWHQIEPFAAYGFNKAHGASYAIVAYITAYLKTHFKAEFMAALMSCEKKNLDKVAEAIIECKKLGIKVLPPDINESLDEFTVIYKESTPFIRFGFSAIKNLGENIIYEILDERKRHGEFVSLEDFLRRMGLRNLNKKALESLIKSGSLDRFGDRKLLWSNLENLLNYSKFVKERIFTKNQISLFNNSSENLLKLDKISNIEEVQDMHWEKEYLGLYITKHPLEKYRDLYEINKYTKIKDIKNLKDNSNIKLFGLISDYKQISTKNESFLIVCNFEDLTGMIDLVIFPRSQDVSLYELKGKIVEILGRVSIQEERVRVLVDKIELFEKKRNKFKIYLPQTLKKQDILKLKNILLKYPGDIPVYIFLLQYRKFLKTDLKVEFNYEIINEVKKVFSDIEIKMDFE